MTKLVDEERQGFSSEDEEDEGREDSEREGTCVHSNRFVPMPQ